jgi:hypothetical protein
MLVMQEILGKDVVIIGVLKTEDLMEIQELRAMQEIQEHQEDLEDVGENLVEILQDQEVLVLVEEESQVLVIL